MTTGTQPNSPGIDRDPIISLVAGLLALVAVCVAIIPVPFTGYVCFPGAAILAAVAAVHGIRALRRLQLLSGSEKAMTLAGLAASAAGILITACSAAVAILLGLRLVEALRQLTP